MPEGFKINPSGTFLFLRTSLKRGSLDKAPYSIKAVSRAAITLLSCTSMAPELNASAQFVMLAAIWSRVSLSINNAAATFSGAFSLSISTLLRT